MRSMDLSTNLAQAISPTGRIRANKAISRATIIETFHHAFEQIGGVSRLAIWADGNPTDFYKLYGRLLPSSGTTELDGPQEVTVYHAIKTNDLREIAPGELLEGTRHEADNPRLPAETDIPKVPRKKAKVGNRSSASKRRKNGSDDKRHNRKDAKL